tara:strand:- start:2449 stop:2748 length:300 start_codon:yes stop_codon:yes gene_type:complete
MGAWQWQGATAQEDTTVNEDNTYNGWTNRATWNVVLWVANDQRAYDVWRAWNPQWDEATVKQFINHIWPDGSTPDGDRTADANLTEIAKSWNEDRKEDQ